MSARISERKATKKQLVVSMSNDSLRKELTKVKPKHKNKIMKELAKRGISPINEEVTA